MVHLELLNSDGTILQNVSNAAGNFHLPDIEDDKNLTTKVYASNSRGRSEMRTVYLQTITPLSASGTNIICILILLIENLNNKT